MPKKKKQPEAEKESGERWLVSYSDFMTLLLGLFIILYSRAATDAAEAGADGYHQASLIAGIAEAFGNSIIFENRGTSIIDGYAGSELISESDIEERNMDIIGHEIEYLAEELEITDELEVVIDETGVHIRITDKVLFNSGSYTINKTAEPILIRIGNIIKTLPNNHIQVEGHTDNIPINTGIISSNWELGALRATNVAKLLISDCALSPTFISAVSYGEHKPLASNSTAEGRATNRRVEISILRNYTEDNSNEKEEKI